MPDFVQLTTAETAAKAKIRQALMRKIKDNLDNLNGRATQVDQLARVFDHFNFADAGAPITLPQDFTLYAGADGDISYPAFSVLRFNNSSTASMLVQTKRNYRFDSVTLPIRLIVRAKKLIDVGFSIGIRPYYSTSLTSNLSTSGLTDGNGIWLERVDSSNWRFVSYNGSRNNGANFAKPTDGNWFVVEIEFTNDPSNQALCRIDGVLKETLSTQLPTTSILHGFIDSVGSGSSPGSNVMDFDSFDYSIVAQLDAA